MAPEQEASNSILSKQMTIDSSLETSTFESIDACLHWGGEVGDESEERDAYQKECTHASLSESIHDWIIVPGERFGPITKETSESELIEIYGADVVRRVDLPVEESESLYDPGTVIFPDDPLRKVSIKWHDEENYRYPSELYVWGDSSLWKTDRGITLGTTVRELEVLNGKPFGLAGFGWDYGGTVLDSNGGVLVELGFEDPDKPSSDWLRRTLLLRVGPKPRPRKDVSMEEYQTITGDIRLLSDHPVLRKVTLKVHDIIVRYDKP